MRLAAPAILALFALSAVACGDDTSDTTGTTSGGEGGSGGDGGGSTTTGPTTTTSTTTTTSSSGGGEGGQGEGGEGGQGQGGDGGQGQGGDGGQGQGGDGGGVTVGQGGAGGGDVEVCAGAAELVPGVIDGTWVGATNNYSPGGAGNDCTGFAADGPDVAYNVSLSAGQELLVVLDSAAADASIYLSTDCADTATSCVLGADDAGGGSGEAIYYVATADVDLALIVDQYAPMPADADSEPFTLDVQIFTPPAGWTCPAIFYGDSDPDALCDCGCGIQDPTCTATNDVALCEGDGCDAGFEPDPANTTQCIESPDDGNTCDGALPLVLGVNQGTWVGATNEYDPLSGGCTGFAATGADVVYSVSLSAGETLDLDLDAASADASLYLVTDCANVGTSCVEGSDGPGGGGGEVLTYTATADVDLFVVVDQFGTSDFVPFTLTAAILNCAPGEFECANGECIDGDFTCDGLLDCADDSDEGPVNAACDCTFECAVDGGDLCLPQSWICDQQSDCDDGSDEVGCADQFTTGAVTVGIPDNLPAGICVDLVSDLTGTIASVDAVEVSASHTWIGDVTFSLVSPDGTTVVLMARPGNPATSLGRSSNLLAAFPITFDPTAATGAEAMGTGVTDVCEDNQICSFFPEPGSLADFAGDAATGTWRFCAVDAGGGDTGTINEVTVSVTRN